MKKPVSIFGLLQVAGLYLALMFMAFALLVSLGIIEGRSSLDLDVNIVFFTSASLFILLGFACRIIELKRIKLYEK